MQFGAVYPQTELNGDPGAVRAIGRAVEALGFDHLLAYDHVLGADHADREPALTGPYTPDDPFHDPFVMFAYLAGITERLQFASAVIIMPQRQTVLVARQAADLALLSGNRFRLGVGVGWNWVEYDALGQDFAKRGRRLDEQIELLRTLWTEPMVEFSGTFDTVDRAVLVPQPTEPVPVWIGGFSEPAFRRAAKHGDGFLFASGARHAHEEWPRLQQMVADAGRSVDDFGGELIVRRPDPADAAAEMTRWAESGGTHTSVVTMGFGFDSAEAHIDYLGKIAEHLH